MYTYDDVWGVNNIHIYLSYNQRLFFLRISTFHPRDWSTSKVFPCGY